MAHLFYAFTYKLGLLAALIFNDRRWELLRWCSLPMIFVCAHEFGFFGIFFFSSVSALSSEDHDYSVLNKTTDLELLETPCIVRVLVLSLTPLNDLFTFATA